MTRFAHLRRLYQVLDELRDRDGGYRHLHECHGRMGWPHQGVYFFFEDGEVRADSENGLRVVRVGTHAVSTGSKTRLWTRLRQHKGTKTGGGNHRGSVFRLLVGHALQRRDGGRVPSLGQRGYKRAAVQQAEGGVEQGVSKYIGKMPFLWVEIIGKAGPDSDRALIERNVIALLSNAEEKPQDDASKNWLGRHSHHEDVRLSGLWNSRHVRDPFDAKSLDVLASYVEGMPKGEKESRLDCNGE